MAPLSLDLLRDLLDEHAAALELYARQWCDAPEDVVQEAFHKLVEQDRAPDNPVGWLYRVVRNGAISAVRAAERRRRHETLAAEMSDGWFVAAEADALDAQAAAEALGQLPLEQREVIVAHLWGGLRFEEIARLSDCSASTAHRRYTAGLCALRERLAVAWPSSTKNSQT